MSWVWIGPSGIAVDIFLPEDGPWSDVLNAQWIKEHGEEGPATRFPLDEPREQRAARRRTPQVPGLAVDRLASEEAPDDSSHGRRTVRNLLPEVPKTHEGGARVPPGSPPQQAAGVMEWLYETAPAANGAALAGIPVRGDLGGGGCYGPGPP
ncbi:hypothetical protein [Streptomyces sp. NPDC015345]|uniref:hypothetical protein n=1 Tax=Streptomyces sp. NPDC015345 TaxID=3364953 RepID=UPI0036F89A66